MPKSVHPDVLDGAFGVIEAHCDAMVATDGEPVDFASVSSGSRLAVVPMSAGDFAFQDATPDGRKCVVGAKPGATIERSGVATHIALIDSIAERILYVTTCADQVLVAGGALSFSSWDIEIGAPV